ncbi:uncharacterized protein LOC140706692 [Pogona vitticeps]
MDGWTDGWMGWQANPEEIRSWPGPLESSIPAWIWDHDSTALLAWILLLLLLFLLRFLPFVWPAERTVVDLLSRCVQEPISSPPPPPPPPPAPPPAAPPAPPAAF